MSSEDWQRGFNDDSGFTPVPSKRSSQRVGGNEGGGGGGYGGGRGGGGYGGGRGGGYGGRGGQAPSGGWVKRPCHNYFNGLGCKGPCGYSHEPSDFGATDLSFLAGLDCPFPDTCRAGAECRYKPTLYSDPAPADPFSPLARLPDSQHNATTWSAVLSNAPAAPAPARAPTPATDLGSTSPHSVESSSAPAPAHRADIYVPPRPVDPPVSLPPGPPVQVARGEPPLFVRAEKYAASTRLNGEKVPANDDFYQAKGLVYGNIYYVNESNRLRIVAALAQMCAPENWDGKKRYSVLDSYLQFTLGAIIAKFLKWYTPEDGTPITGHPLDLKKYDEGFTIQVKSRECTFCFNTGTYYYVVVASCE